MVGEKSTDSVGRNRSRSRSPQPKKKPERPQEKQPLLQTQIYYAPKGRDEEPTVPDNDIFLLPGRDYEIMFALTFLAVIVRLYKIWQPSSVVFDEVQ